jgi:hypothetical protein
LAIIGIINGEVDASKAISETDEELVIPAILAREAVLPYPKGRAYRSAKELEDALFTFSKAWVTAEKHPEPLISIVTDRKRQIKGELTDIVFDADAVNPAGKKSPAVRANVHLFKKTLSKQFMDDVKSGRKRDVSVGFTYDTVEKTGEWQGEKYDYAQENLLINHVAVSVPVGRMRAPFIGLGCDCVDFETETANSGLEQNSVSETVDSAAKIEITLPITHENTSNLIGKLKQIANW